MTQEEMSDLSNMKAAMVSEREHFFNVAISIDRADATLLEMMGYGRVTKDQAIASCFRDSLKRLDRILKAHAKKWPD